MLAAKGELIGILYNLNKDKIVGDAIVANDLIDSAAIWHKRLGHMS